MLDFVLQENSESALIIAAITILNSNSTRIQDFQDGEDTLEFLSQGPLFNVFGSPSGLTKELMAEKKRVQFLEVKQRAVQSMGLNLGGGGSGGGMNTGNMMSLNHITSSMRILSDEAERMWKECEREMVGLKTQLANSEAEKKRLIRELAFMERKLSIFRV
jgi:hypothetical protein